MLVLVAAHGRFQRVKRMRWLIYLIPSLFLLTASMAMDGARDLPIVRLQVEANIITARMNDVSENISQLVQDVNLGRKEYGDIEEQLNRADLQMDELKHELGLIWGEIDDHNVGIARDEIIRKLLRGSGVIFGTVGLALIADRHRDHSPNCLLAAGLLLIITVI